MPNRGWGIVIGSIIGEMKMHNISRVHILFNLNSIFNNFRNSQFMNMYFYFYFEEKCLIY